MTDARWSVVLFAAAVCGACNSLIGLGDLPYPPDGGASDATLSGGQDTGRPGFEREDSGTADVESGSPDVSSPEGDGPTGDAPDTGTTDTDSGVAAVDAAHEAGCTSASDCPPVTACNAATGACSTSGCDTTLKPCNGGCCDITGVCQPGTRATACNAVAGGGVCLCSQASDCPPYEGCVDASCGDYCGADDTCNGGCCLTSMGFHLCTAGNVAAACGTGGGACATCAMGVLCTMGVCQ
jgi:hypothetical protein